MVCYVELNIWIFMNFPKEDKGKGDLAHIFISPKYLREDCSLQFADVRKLTHKSEKVYLRLYTER
jgi:hypothetical protein